MERRSEKGDVEKIKGRVEIINATLGTKFTTKYDPILGRWLMYEVGEKGELRNSDLGFASISKSTREMLAYTDAIFAMFQFLRHHKEKISEIKW